MKKYIILTTVALLLVATTTVSQAQNAPGNLLPPTPSKFTDIIEVNPYNMPINESGLTVGIRNVFAYKPTNYYSIGGGIELGTDGTSSYSVPLSADFRYYFNPGKYAAPFLSINGGYAFNFDNFNRLNDGNLFLGGNFGINIVLTNNMSLQMALGLKLERYGYILPDNPSHYSSNNLYLPFTIGLAF